MNIRTAEVGHCLEMGWSWVPRHLTHFQAGWKGDEVLIDFKVIIKQKLNMNTTLAVTHTWKHHTSLCNCCLNKINITLITLKQTSYSATSVRNILKGVAASIHQRISVKKCKVTILWHRSNTLLTCIPSNTSGAIHAALPLLFVMYVFMSQAVPKSQIFKTVPHFVSNKLKTIIYHYISRK